MRKLQPETHKWVEGLKKKYVFEDHHLRLLQIAAEAWDRAQAAREVLDEQGLVVHDKNGVPKTHPYVLIELQSKNQFMRSLRELGLDLAEEPGKPPTIQSARRSHGSS